LKLADIADRLECVLEGDGDVEIRGVAGIEEAGPGDLTFFANPRYADALKATAASAVIAGDGVTGVPCGVLRARQPYLAFARAVELFSDARRPAPGVHPLAAVAEGVMLGPDVSVGPFVVLEEGVSVGARTVLHPHVVVAREAVLGDDCVVHARVSIRERVRIGNRVVIQDGAVIGGDGFGFARRTDGSHHKIPQIGGVVVEDDVEIGALSAIDRPAVGVTRIGAGTKIDNLVQVAHGVTVGRDVLLAAQVGIAGSTTVEDGVTLAGQVGVAGHLTIGRGVIATAQTGIPSSLEPGAFVSGYPAIPNREWLKSSAVFRRLPELKKVVNDLETRLAALEAQLAAAELQGKEGGRGACHNRGSMLDAPFLSVASVRRLAAALAAAALAVAGTSAAVRPPKLDYTMRTLDNGLNVVFLEDHSTPIVHAALWYHVGSKNEKPGRTGFAHLFEHMMFKGSKNVEPEGHPSYISSVGGQSNAYTEEDYTVFWETVPGQYLPLVLWLEADRMASLRVDQKVFETEREVVKEERRMKVENQPYGRLTEILYDQAFTTHPYKHATIGSMRDLEAASIEDVRDFFRTYYVPNNATLVLVGDFDTTEALALVTKYLGRVPKSTHPVPRDIPAEPPQTKEKRVTLREAWPLPAVVVAYHITYDGHPDSYPLHIASKVLSDGQSARIYRDLVYEKQLALAAFGGGEIVEDPNLFYAIAIVQPGKTPEEVIDALIAEFERLKTEPITDEELQQAKNQFARDYILGRESNRDKALQLAHAVVIHDDITTADGEFDIFMNTTAADVQRVSKIYFNANNRLVLTILPGGPSGSGEAPQ
jgi:UDP-3-O-[3-hydroxymyristoyl] glucosamine N-acyltransferase LpxD